MRLSWADFVLDEERFELRRAGAKVPVQPKVLELLFVLARAGGRVVLRSELFDAVWAGVAVTEASLSRAVLEARRAIGDDLQQVVVTVRGRGFRFAAEVRESSGDPGSGPRVSSDLTDPTFIGRESAMTCLLACLEEAEGGHGTVVWISGEAGIGKTRTADELARRATARGAAVHTASAHETPPAPQFWLWAEVARTLARVLDQASAAELLETALPLLSGPRELPPEKQFGLFDTFTRHLVLASAARPQVLIFDDAHWADDGSQQLLRFVAREVRRARVLIVCTYLDTARGDGPRARAFGALLGDSAGLSLPLRGLGPDDIPRFVEVTSGSTPSESLARALFERTGGNPLYLRQVLQTEWAERALTETAHAIASSMDLQQGLVESIQRHLQGVSRDGREVLTLAAVLGREFSVTELLAVSGVDSRTLLDRLDEGVRARILLTPQAGVYAFTHTLVHDVLYKSLSSAERAKKHGLIGAALLDHFGASFEAHVEALAIHFVRALPGGDPERAFDMSVRAARRASLGDLHEAAARHWLAASQALSYLAADDTRHIDANLGAGAAYAKAGARDRARVAYLDAATLARTFDKRSALAEAAIGFAEVTERANATRRALLTEALHALEARAADGPSGTHARLVGLLSPGALAASEA